MAIEFTPPQLVIAMKRKKGRSKVLVANPPFDAITREGLEGYASGRFQAQAEVKRFFEGFPNFPRNRKGEIVQQRVTDILTNRFIPASSARSDTTCIGRKVSMIR